MKQQKGAPQTKKVVWRMTEAAPQGEFVDASKPAPPAPTSPAAPKRDTPEVSYGSWLESSFELLNGAEVNDGPDTVPDELFDELFASAAPQAKPTEPNGAKK